MDGAAVSFGGCRRVYAVVPSVGAVCRMVGGDGQRDGDGGGAGVEDLGLSGASALISGFGGERWDVCGGACIAVEPGSFCVADCCVPCGQGGRWERRDRSVCLCWVEPDGATELDCGASHR